MHEHSDLRTGIRAGLPFGLPVLALGISFGVLARPLMGPVAPIVMSVVVYSGAAQFAALTVLTAGDGTFDRGIIVGGTLPQAAGWMGGTALGVIGGSALAHPGKFGLDAVFPAFYLALAFEEVEDRRKLTAAVLGGAIALALMPWAPAGVPVIAAAAAALLGLRRR
jgi:predicted branched-subunit amino acid permease